MPCPVDKYCHHSVEKLMVFFLLICPKGFYCGYGVGFFHFKIFEENMYTYSIQSPKVIKLQYEKQKWSMYMI